MMRKAWLKITAILLLIPLGAFLSGLYLIHTHQDKLIQEALDYVNDHISGTMTIAKVSIAPFKNFPYVSIDLQDVLFFESKDLNTKPLYAFRDVYMGFDIKAVLSGHYDIKSIQLEQGHLDIVHRCDGSYNILEAKNLHKATDSSSSTIHLDLKKLSFKGIDIAFVDEPGERQLNIALHTLQAKIKYQGAHLYLDLLSDLNLDVIENHTPTFFSNKAIHLDLELDVDQDSQQLHIMPSKATLQDATFLVAGTMDFPNDMEVDISIRGDKPNFNLFTAFLPDDLAADLQRYQHEGNIFFEGQIVGKTLNGHVPAVNVLFGCENAYFLNKEANKKLDQMRFQGSFSNGPERSLRSSSLHLRNVFAKPDEGVFEGDLYIRNFIDPTIRLDVHADLDLDFLGKFFRLRELDEVGGKILLDINFNEIVDLNFPGESLAKLKSGIDSELFIHNVSFNAKKFGHRVSKLNGHAIMRQGAITLDSISLHIGNSDFRVSGSLSDFPALFHQYDTPIRMSLNTRSKHIDLPNLLAFDTLLAKQYDESIENLSLALAFECQAKDLFSFQYLPKGEFYIDDFYAKFKHYPHVLHDIHADVIITDTDLQLIDFSGEIDKSDFHFSGKLTNYTKWFQPSPKGDSRLEFELSSNYFSPHDILSYKGENLIPPDYRDEEFKQTRLHGRVDMHYDQGFQSVDLYLDELSAKMNLHPLKLEKWKGRAHYENEHLLLEGFSGNIGKSDVNINMSYFLGDKPGQQSRNNYLNLESRVLDLDALTGYQGANTTENHADAFNLFAVPFPNMSISASIGRLNYHRYWLEQVSTKLRVQANHYLYVDTLDMRLADGHLAMHGYFNGSDPNHIYYHSQMKAHNLDIDKLLFKFDNFGQDMLVNEKVHGKITGQIKSTFRMHPDLTPILDKSDVHMDLSITNGSILDFAPIMAMSEYFRDKNLRVIRFDTLQNVLDLKDGQLSIPKMVINSSIGFLELSGQQKLDLSMAYFVRVPLKLVTQIAWRKLFGGKNKEDTDISQVDEIEEIGDLNKVRFLNISITGTPDQYDIKLGKNASDKEKRKRG